MIQLNEEEYMKFKLISFEKSLERLYPISTKVSYRDFEAGWEAAKEYYRRVNEINIPPPPPNPPPNRIIIEGISVK